MDTEYRIGELAQLTNVTPRTIRYYESLGLLAPQRDDSSGYRYYTDIQRDRLQKIIRMKDAGLSLDDISQIIDLLMGDKQAELQGKQQIILEKQLADVDHKIDQLTQLRTELQQHIAELNAFLDEE